MSGQLLQLLCDEVSDISQYFISIIHLVNLFFILLDLFVYFSIYLPTCNDYPFNCSPKLQRALKHLTVKDLTIIKDCF